MLLLDLFCGAGGAAVGYQRAGFTKVVGVDIRPQRRYPFSHWPEEALGVLDLLARGKTWHGYRAKDFATIHASPPCQAYSTTRHLPNTRPDHPDLVATTRELLVAVGRPWVIENVPGAPLSPYSITLCGLMFGLKVFRHRLFESSLLLLAPSHPTHRPRRVGVGGMVCVVGNGGGHGTSWRERRRAVPPDHRTKAAWSRAMGIDWMTQRELAQAVPPAYTRYVGLQLVAALG